MKNPNYAYGSYEALKKEIAKGDKSEIKYPSYAWLRDTLQYAYINKKQEIELVGLPKLTGTLEKKIIISELDSGVYAVRGEYKITPNAETTFLAGSYILVIVNKEIDTTKVRVITADNILDYDISSGEITTSDQVVTSQYLEEHGYTTEEVVDIKIAAMKETLEQEMQDYVDDVIVQQLETLLPTELDKLVQPVPSSDISNLFNESI